MKKSLYIFASIILVCAAIFTVSKVINYSYTEQYVLKENPTPPPKQKPATDNETEPQDTEIIHTDNAFEALRGATQIKKGETPPPPPSNTDYEFEIRAIHILGDKKMALISAAPIRKSSRSNSRTKQSAQPAKTFMIGDVVGSTGYKVSSIEPGLVFLTDSSGKQHKHEFSLSSPESLKRAEIAQRTQIKKPVISVKNPAVHKPIIPKK